MPLCAVPKMDSVIYSLPLLLTQSNKFLPSVLIPALSMQTSPCAKQLPQQVDFYRLVAPIGPGKVGVETTEMSPSALFGVSVENKWKPNSRCGILRAVYTTVRIGFPFLLYLQLQGI